MLSINLWMALLLRILSLFSSPCSVLLCILFPLFLFKPFSFCIASWVLYLHCFLHISSELSVFKLAFTFPFIFNISFIFSVSCSTDPAVLDTVCFLYLPVRASFFTLFSRFFNLNVSL